MASPEAQPASRKQPARMRNIIVLSPSKEYGRSRRASSIPPFERLQATLADGGFNDSVDNEPSLGATTAIDQTLAWSAAPPSDDRELEHDGREPDADLEPSEVYAFAAE